MKNVSRISFHPICLAIDQTVQKLIPKFRSTTHECKLWCKQNRACDMCRPTSSIFHVP